VFQVSSKRKRVAAALVDAAVTLGIVLLMTWLFGSKYTTPEGEIRFKLTGLKALTPFMYWFIIMPILEAVFGQTIGKKFLGIKVISADYSKATLIQVFVRHLFDVIDWLPGFGIVGLLVASNNPNSQRVGDLVAKTIVVEAKQLLIQ
jgi:uncharacterized RDD family membrane protein YckC